MILQKNLADKGFAISSVDKSDFDVYFEISRACYEKYVNEYFDGWVDEFQLTMNTDAFNKEMGQSTFMKLLLNDEIVGFFAFDELGDKIDGVMIQMIETAREKGFGSFYLNHITSIANNTNKSIFLQVFKSNPAKNLYERFGFTIYDESISHYQMRYDPISA